MVKRKRPQLVIVDVIGTTPSRMTAKIIEVAVIQIFDRTTHRSYSSMINPLTSFAPVGSLNEESVENAPYFAEIATIIQRKICHKGAVILGDNLTNYSLPLLDQAFCDGGCPPDWTDITFIDLLHEVQREFGRESTPWTIYEQLTGKSLPKLETALARCHGCLDLISTLVPDYV